MATYCLSVFIKRLHAKCGYMEYFSCLLSPERCPPHCDKKCLRLDGLHQLHSTWQISGWWSHFTQKFFGEEGFFFPQTKQLLIWPQSKQNLSYYCIKLWGTTYDFFFSFSFIQSDVLVISVVCVVKKIKDKIYLYNLISKTVTKVFFFPFTLHSSSEESFLRGPEHVGGAKKMCKYGNLLIKELN